MLNLSKNDNFYHWLFYKFLAHCSSKSNKSYPFLWQAFGVGAFEEADDNIYAIDHMSNYDTELGGDTSSGLHGWTGPQKENSRGQFSVGAVFFKGIGQGVPFHAVTDKISFMEYFFFGGLLHRFEYLFYPSCSYRGDN